MYNVESIKNYIWFLKRECNLSITIHPCEDEEVIKSSELITFNIHDNPYCIYVKTFDGVWQHCINRQKKINEKCKNGSFCGKCFAGVWEFVYPIMHKEKCMGFISVSGYKIENPESYFERTANKYNIPQERLETVYKTLKQEIPDKKWVDSLLYPLCDMLELLYIKTDDTTVISNEPIKRIIRYVKQYHYQNITVDDICDYFGFSRSYMSHIFKKNVGKSVREYLTELRIEDAKTLLKYSNLTVTEIALSIGFSDSTYFSNVFKSKVGVSPSVYRKE